jgi:hypothetical protein
MDQKPAGLSPPSIGAFDNPSPFVAAQFPSISVFPFIVVLPIQRDVLPFLCLPQRVGALTPLGNHSFRLLSRSALGQGIRTCRSMAFASITPERALSGIASSLPNTTLFVPCPTWCCCRPYRPLLGASEAAISRELWPKVKATYRAESIVPVCITHRVLSKHVGLLAERRSSLSFLCRGSVNNSLINFHSSSIQQLHRLRRKSSIWY